MQSTANSKAELRNVLRQRRRDIPDDVRAQASFNIALHATQIPHWPDARHIALYLTADGEVETSYLHTLAVQNNTAVYLPCVSSEGAMSFRLWQPDTELISNCYGIPEPGPDVLQCPPDSLDIIFLPLVGWSKSGARLGMGGGYYDRVLADSKAPVLAGLGFNCQEVANMPLEDWDISLDFVATESALHDCRLKNGPRPTAR